MRPHYEAEKAFAEKARTESLVDLRAKVDSGDSDAAVQLKQEMYLSMLADLISSSRSRIGKSLKVRKDKVGIESMLNPSRVLESLRVRGLVERRAYNGRGASVRLTDAGRVLAHKLIEAKE